MDIEGVYTEKDEEKKSKHIAVTDECQPYDAMLPQKFTAGEFFQKQKEGICFAFRPRQTAEEVRQKFLRELSHVNASEDFKKAAQENMKVIRTYLPVEYFTVTQYEKTRWSEVKHYNTTGYDIDGEISDDKVKVDVSEHKEYSHSTYEAHSTTINRSDKVYFSYFINNGLDKFALDFYKTTGADSSMLIPVEEIKDDYVLEDRGASWYHHDFLGEAKKWDLHQILMFPMWTVQVTLKNKTYINYVSDISHSNIVYYEHPEEEKVKLAEEHQNYKEKDAKMSTRAVSLASISSLIGLITIFIHMFGYKKEGHVYRTFLANHLGGFGVLLTVIGGFSIIGYIFVVVALCNLKIENSKGQSTKTGFDDVKKDIENCKKQIASHKLSIICSVIGFVIYMVETVLYLIF